MSAAARNIGTPTFLTKEQVCQITHRTPRWVEIMASEGKIRSIDSTERAANGRPIRLYVLESLPRTAQQKWSDMNQLTPAAPTAITPAPQSSLFAAAPSAPAHVALPNDDADRQARERLEMLQPIFEYRADRERYATIKLSDGRAITSESRLIEWIAAQRQTSVRTLRQWLSRYQAGGYAALADRPRGDKGKSRWFEAHPQAKVLVAAAYLEAGRTKNAAYESLVSQCEKLGLQRDEIPCYDTVAAYLDSPDIPLPMKVWARQGDKALNESCAPYLQRKYTDIPANGIWISDHMIHDVFVRNDCFLGVAQDAQMRLRLTALLDMRTRMVVGYSWTPEGSSRSIATAWRMALQRYGAPQEFYCDNGKDYQKFNREGAALRKRDVVEGYLDDAEWISKGILAALGISTTYCIKYHPQSKHIERFFRTLHMRCDALFAHYTTGNAYNRPDAANAAMAEHKKLITAGRGVESPLMPASEFILICTHWIEDEYNAGHAHRGAGMNGRTPRDVFDSLYPQEQRVAPPAHILDQLFYSRVERKVDAAAIRLGGQRYIGADDDSTRGLYLSNGENVLIHYDPNDCAEAIVTTLDGAHQIARVRPEILVEQNASANEMIAASMQQRRALRNATAESVRAIRREAHRLGAQSPFEQLRDGASRLLAEAGADAITALTTQRAGAVSTLPTTNPSATLTCAEDIAETFAKMRD